MYDPENELRAYVAREITLNGDPLVTVYDDGRGTFEHPTLTAKEMQAVTLALITEAVRTGLIKSGDSVDEAMHALELAVRSPTESPF